MNESFTDEETWLEFMVALKSLARSEHLTETLRLEALDEACTRAIGGSVMDAKEFVEDQVALGTSE
jgi:hypothetical protein